MQEAEAGCKNGKEAHSGDRGRVYEYKGSRCRRKRQNVREAKEGGCGKRRRQAAGYPSENA